jgi:acetylornithine deacetylase/succinyl-diaminopimelate desuccinylase-like protein
MDIKSVISFAEKHSQRFIDDLVEFVEIPSVSSSSEHIDDVRRCADFLKDKMLQSGLQRAEIFETAGHPVVYGEWLGAEGKAHCTDLWTLRCAARRSA